MHGHKTSTFTYSTGSSSQCTFHNPPHHVLLPLPLPPGTRPSRAPALEEEGSYTSWRLNPLSLQWHLCGTSLQCFPSSEEAPPSCWPHGEDPLPLQTFINEQTSGDEEWVKQHEVAVGMPDLAKKSIATSAAEEVPRDRDSLKGLPLQQFMESLVTLMVSRQKVMYGIGMEASCLRR